MPVFPIKWQLSVLSMPVEKGRPCFKLGLNDEWTIICVLRDPKWYNMVADTIKIHRKNTSGDYIVNGELSFEKKGYVNSLPKIQISQSIKTGSTLTEIWSNLFSWNIGPNYFINGFLNISEVNEKQLTILTNKESKQRILPNSFEKLSKDFERLLNSESSLADVKLRCDSVSIPAHKNILSARSPVFAAMFAHPMKGSLKNEVDITDINISILLALLVYMYTGRTSNLTASSLIDLLLAAEKYQVQDLEAVCTNFLKETASHQIPGQESSPKILNQRNMDSENLTSFVAVLFIILLCVVIKSCGFF